LRQFLLDEGGFAGGTRPEKKNDFIASNGLSSNWRLICIQQLYRGLSG
jgi:hypothetical protein